MRLSLTYKFYLPLCFLLLSTFGLKAGHIVGGEVSYTCMGWQNNDPSTGIRVYEVLINMYRDTIGQGAYFDGVAGLMQGTGPNGGASVGGHMTIYRGNTVFTDQETLQLRNVSPVDVNLGNPCLIILEPVGQEIGIYRFTIELPVSTEPYTLAYQRCCRNGAIRNLRNAVDIGSTYFITITPESQERCNASPVFNFDPPIAFCVGEPFSIDMSATDANGDSLVYVLCNPVVGGGTDGLGPGGNNTRTPFDDLAPTTESPPPYTDAVFTAGFNVADQLGRGAELAIDPVTGQLTGVPQNRGTFALAICIEEWSRGPDPILLSNTKREFQLVINVCANQVMADLLETEIDEFGRFFIRQCGPGENTIINESTREDFIVSYDWELDGPDGLLTGEERDFFTSITEVGVYEGTMFLNSDIDAANCRDTAEFLLGVFPDLTADFTFTEPLCDVVTIDFIDQSTVGGNNFVTSFNWDFGDGNGNNTSVNPSHLYLDAGVFPVTLSQVDNNGCTAEATIDVSYFPIPQTLILNAQDGFGCTPFERQFENLARPVNDLYEFEWRFGDGNTSDEPRPINVYEEPGMYDVYLGVTSPLGCFVDANFPGLIDVRQTPIAGFTWQPDEITSIRPDFTVTDASQLASSVRYEITNREGERQLFTRERNFDFRFRDSSALFVNQIVRHPAGCFDTIVQEIPLRLVNTFFVPNAFTPNGDGLNDSFVPTGILFGATEYLFRVWNRWGALVFSTDNPTAGWDGTFNGADSPGGGYLWDASFISIGGELEQYKGGVTLLR